VNHCFPGLLALQSSVLIHTGTTARTELLSVMPVGNPSSAAAAQRISTRDRRCRAAAAGIGRLVRIHKTGAATSYGRHSRRRFAVSGEQGAAGDQRRTGSRPSAVTRMNCARMMLRQLSM
jgi:hypothetical protein